MERNVTKDIEEYKSEFLAKNVGKFYADDIFQICEISSGKDGGVNLYTHIENALMFGFMVGYRCAKRDAGKRR